MNDSSGVGISNRVSPSLNYPQFNPQSSPRGGVPSSITPHKITTTTLPYHPLPLKDIPPEQKRISQSPSPVSPLGVVVHTGKGGEHTDAFADHPRPPATPAGGDRYGTEPLLYSTATAPAVSDACAVACRLAGMVCVVCVICVICVMRCDEM